MRELAKQASIRAGGVTPSAARGQHYSHIRPATISTPSVAGIDDLEVGADLAGTFTITNLQAFRNGAAYPI
jgi:hypothetical protein